jgi:hypothetical protein
MEQITKIPIQVAKQPKDRYVVHQNRYWIVLDNSILLYKGRSPQCNHNKMICEKIRDKLYPEASVEFIETVYLPQVM